MAEPRLADGNAAESVSFAPRRVPARAWRGPVLGVVALGVGMVLVAMTSRLQAPTPGRTFSSMPGVRPTLAPELALRPLPPRIGCHELDRSECHAMVRVALDSLPPGIPRVIASAAWPTLLCGSTLDCPPGQLRQVSPRGSVILHFGSGIPDMALNVADHLDEAGGTVAVAWAIPWSSLDIWSATAPRGVPPGQRTLPG